MSCTHGCLHLQRVAGAVSAWTNGGHIEVLLGTAIRVVFKLIAMLERMPWRGRPMCPIIHTVVHAVVRTVIIEIIVVYSSEEMY
jgi:hypothetical protein